MSSVEQKKVQKISKVRRQDPFFARESARYEFPLPSREYIAQVLEAQGKPVSFSLLCALLDITKAEQDAFARRLGAMEREGTLLQNRKGAYILPERASLIAGRVEGHPDGFGFLRPDDGSPDIFLDGHQMAKVLHGDKVLVRVMGVDRKGRPEGKIVEITERSNRMVVGRVAIEHGVVFVVPENRRISQDILIPPDEEAGKAKRKKKEASKPVAGQVVMVEIMEPPSRYSNPIGRIVEVVGNYADPGMEIEIALRKHELPFAFGPEVEAENARVPQSVSPEEWQNDPARVDLRHLPLVTIDGETARDFDDAVYAERSGGRNWRLVVAIADVSHYVKPGMALDKEAMARGNSVYFPRRVIPMLPERLSNGICSLNPEVDRLAMVCDMEISCFGNLRSYQFYPAVFRSHARLTYTQVWQWLSGEVKPETEVHQGLQPHLQHLFKLYQTLAKARQKRGAIDFETVETQMLFNGQGKIEKIVPSVRNEAHKIIEECMLAANVCAANFLHKHKHPCLYRIHEGPTPERLDNLRTFLSEFGIGLAGGENPSAKDYAGLLEQIKPRPDAQLLQTVMLRSLRQAMYSPDNVGHFGLAYEAYAHFTSPIRRYPDLLVHRAIKAVLQQKQYQPGDWSQIGLHCSMTERRADEATRDVENWLKCFFMKERIGEEFDGTIAAVVPFGIFVALDEVYVEGLVHVSELGEEYFNYDAAKHHMLGERSGKRFRLGDRLRVRLVRVDMEANKIDFVLAPVPIPALAHLGENSPVKTEPRTSRQASRSGESSPRTAREARSRDTGNKTARGNQAPAKAGRTASKGTGKTTAPKAKKPAAKARSSRKASTVGKKRS
jgi:ribonuclease R